MASIIKFSPFSSSVESSFWVRYCREKLETIQLNEQPVDLSATYSVTDGTPRLQCQETSLQVSSNDKSIVGNDRVLMPGSLVGYNTLESFQKVDKNIFLRDFFEKRFFQEDDKAVVKSLNTTALLTFADLKNHKVLYWFGIPALMPQQSIQAMSQPSLLKETWEVSECESLTKGIHLIREQRESASGLAPFFLYDRKTKMCQELSKESYASMSSSESGLIFCFFDPVSDVTVMGWPLRNLVAYLSLHLDLGGKQVSILSVRTKRLSRKDAEVTFNPNDDESLLLSIQVPTKEDYGMKEDNVNYKVVGWELNIRSKPGPRWVNLRPLLDSNHLATQAADLNLKLMKWRMLPALNVEKLQNTKVLLIGAGTLGCSVARTLLGWGIRHFTIVDYGNVSYSNPVRQNLFTLEDCHADNGCGRPKAVAAAEALKQIAADVHSQGLIISIPMPGHASENAESIQKAVDSLDKLVQDTDAVFLLTDTRESRWLPTVMAAAHNKMLINAALGLDSWLVMRHGGGIVAEEDKNNSNPKIRYGCYFCNDVVAPENSTRNRTLDQQCTVTRPGLAPIASSMAVELMVALMHHDDYLAAPAPSNSHNSFAPDASDKKSPLGVIPQQIRGSLVSYTMMTPSVPAFCHCTACSEPVVNAYRENKIEMVAKTCQSVDGTYLENLSGLTAFRAEAAEKMNEFDDQDLDWGDDE